MVDRNLSTSTLSLALSPDSDRAEASTADDAKSVSLAPRLTSAMAEDTSALLPSTNVRQRLPTSYKSLLSLYL